MWFEVDKQGLGKLLERKGKAFLLFELIQNALDEATTRVDVSLTRIPGTRNATLRVEDNNPRGFLQLTHAFTLFAESAKKADATKRGRYNLGEKLCLALCQTAEIRSTQGGFRFDAAGRHPLRARRAAGSLFTGTLKLTNEELAECHAEVLRLLPPANVEVYYNGTRIASRTPCRTVAATLPTEIADEEGRLRRSTRKTEVEFFEPRAGEPATLYELGIPVVATGDRFHVNVLQKVLLNFDRDNVTPAYLAQIRALTVEHLTETLTVDDANSAWVRNALQTHGDDLPDTAIARLADLRFGEKRVAYDPSDREANSRAMAAGYTVVHGNSLSAAEWQAVKRVSAILPAGQVTPSPKPFAAEGTALKTLAPEQWTPGIRAVVAYAERIAARLLGVQHLSVTIASDMGWPFAGAYGSGALTLNLNRLGHRWFDGPLGPITDLLIHEFAHHYEANHLSEAYYHALSRLGGQLVEWAVREPAAFVLDRRVVA